LAISSSCLESGQAAREPARAGKVNEGDNRIGRMLLTALLHKLPSKVRVAIELDRPSLVRRQQRFVRQAQ